MTQEEIQRLARGYKGITRLGTNHETLHFENMDMFQSYGTVIAVVYAGTTYLTSSWDYSTTTGKYRNQFLGENIHETRDKIRSGEYKLLK